MSKKGWTLVALAAAAIVLAVVTWFDNTVLPDAEQRWRTSGPAGVDSLTTIKALESLLVAGSVLLLGVLASRSASVLVGLAYVVVGGFFAAQWWLWWNLAAGGNEVLPEVIGLALRDLFYWSTGGSSVNDVGTVGAGMLLGGSATIARWWRGRALAASRMEVGDPTTRPMSR